MKHRVLAIGVAIAAAFAALTIVVGCSEPMTLEKYFNEHSSEWTDIQDQLKDVSGEMFSLDLSVEGNEIKQIMTYTETFDAENVAAMKAYFQEQEANLIGQIQNSIAQVEKGAGIDGITWYVQFNNGDGSEIFSTTIDKNSQAASAPADTATDTSGAGA